MRLKIEIGANKANFSEIPNSHYKTLEEAFCEVHNLCFVLITNIFSYRISLH